jgi:hypothetical protein
MPSTPPKSSPVIKDRWNLELAYHPRVGEKESANKIPRRSALYFLPGQEWRVLDSEAGGAVAVERALGGGSIVLISESFPLSNQGLREARNADLIARMIGPARVIDFDENHFGVADTGSVGTLLRKYGLEGGEVVLIVAAALFMWRSGSSFLPQRESAPEQAVAGRDAQEGLTSLLRRSVPEADLLDTCYAEWSRTAPPARKAAAVETAIKSNKGRNAAEIYREASRALTAPRPSQTAPRPPPSDPRQPPSGSRQPQTDVRTPQTEPRPQGSGRESRASATKEKK